MTVKITPAVILHITCDKCKKSAPDVATIPIGVPLVRKNMEEEGWVFYDSILKPESPPDVTCPSCAKILNITNKPSKLTALN
jgi:hypothetical protein